MTPHSLSQSSLPQISKLQYKQDLKDPKTQLGLIERLKEIKEHLDSSSDDSPMAAQKVLSQKDQA